MRQGTHRRRDGRWPLLPIAPGIVAVIALATAVVIAVLGITELQRASDDAAATRSRVLAATIAARVRTTALEDRPVVMAQAARRAGAEAMLVDQTGRILVDQSLGQFGDDDVLRLLVDAEGLTESRVGRVSFAATPLSPPLEHLSVLTFVRAPEPADGTVALTRAVALLTALLLGVAVTVAWTFARAIRDDVTFVRRRISEMAAPAPASADGSPSAAHNALPVRSLDQVGLLTTALNVLVTRFDAAERSYRADLARAAELDTERTRFLAGLSHELRTPLNAILGFTHLLASEDEGPLSPSAKEAVGMIGQSGEHLRLLIDDILDLSAMETGQLKLSRETIELHSLCEEVLREARAAAKDRPLTLALEGPTPCHVLVDRRRIRQILTNLVSNAVKFTAEGQIVIRLEDADDGLRVRVVDTGRGIAPRHLNGIFEAYRQAGTVAERREGAGLGLAIARSLAVLHGGRIEVASKLGEGSTFTVWLPRRASLVPQEGQA